jgi:hypothetical protein
MDEVRERFHGVAMGWHWNEVSGRYPIFLGANMVKKEGADLGSSIDPKSLGYGETQVS